ncbi:hypothetical protein TNCV_1075281 [Trichonephila clavipes]|uniref:Uncharacterized protein n=1 Tax=Trichonephila clavipes TaxID=2585209 RepID=A0A8X6T3H4_TRICX|nr:hypothetical protein TNCV_1075281 [Trichonephila clavipes]
MYSAFVAGLIIASQAASPAVRLVEGEESWEAPDPLQDRLLLNMANDFSLPPTPLGGKREEQFIHGMCPETTKKPCDGALSALLLIILLGYLRGQNDNSFQPTQEENAVMKIRNCIGFAWSARSDR